MECLKYCENYQNVIHKHEVSDTVGKVVPTDLHKVATNHQFILKKTVSAKQNNVKPNKMRYSCNMKEGNTQNYIVLIQL